MLSYDRICSDGTQPDDLQLFHHDMVGVAHFVNSFLSGHLTEIMVLQRWHLSAGD